jgi:hypothetical protein
MGSLVSGLFDLLSGNPYQAQQNQLQELGGYQTKEGEGLTTAGSKFEQDILSGDPTRIASALAPEISTGAHQVEQSRLQNANFGTRSGGTAAATQAAEAQNRGNIINLEGGLQAGTAGAAVGQGMNLMRDASGNILDVANLENERRNQVTGDVGGIASGVAQIATGLPFGGAGAGGADPYATLYNAQHPDRTSISTVPYNF